MIVLSYLTYLLISVAVTVWVAHTLHKNGRIFLIDSFHGNAELADSVNHLLVVGFYLINIGYVAVALRAGRRPETWPEFIETLSSKVGVVLLVLGLMHFINIKVFSGMRRRAIQPPRPPVPPSQHVTPPAGV
jgi:hypothetical protein